MKVVTAQEMREIDRITIEEYGIPGLVLMERAGLAVASRFRELYPSMKALVLCGSGNNGGDGLATARNLFNWGFKVHVLMLAKKNSMGPDCTTQYRIAKKTGISVDFRTAVTERDLHGAAVIDAVFGAGLSRPVGKDIAGIFALLNNADVPVMSVDIPSGVSSDTGEVLGAAVRADCTVTFGLPKRGHLLYPGAGYAGKLFTEDIGFPAQLLMSDKLKINLINGEMVSGLIAPRHRNSYKGDYGHVLVVAGSRGKTGAAFMTARACLKSGSGLVTLGIPESLMDIFQSRVTEEMTLPLPDDGRGMMSEKALDVILEFASKKADVIAVGPGIGVSSRTEGVMRELIQSSPAPVVIDADGLNSLSAATDTEHELKAVLQRAKAPVVLTPHPGEMARLLKKTGSGIQDMEKERINVAASFSQETGVCLVLKGVPTVVAAPGGDVFINTSGNPGMAAAGAGDVLTGVIASLLGQGLNPVDASLSGVYLHGLSGDRAAKKKGERSMVASDIIDFLPDVFIPNPPSRK
ncbi:MAG: NAD(P)H-hydrate dehydratase [Nitrospirae bacterium]|nr:NAD(P)H-hydrate dehydratase [Nitrospirota bacterium]